MQITDDSVPRRGFLERLTAAALPLLALTVGPRPARAGAAGTTPDESWLRGLTGRHRTVFDVEAHKNGHALAQAKNFLDGWEQAYGVPRREVNLVLGVRGAGLPLVMADAVWAKYRLGDQYGVADPSRGAAAARNVFTAAHVQPDGPVTAEQTVEALQRRGVLFLLCNNTVTGGARRLAAAGLGSPDAIRDDILANVLPGVVVVPAMVIAFTRMQERGIGYVYAG